MLLNISKTGLFFIGVAAGAAAIAIMRSETFKKTCSKIICAGMQAKDQVSHFVETVKEDAEDMVAQARSKKEQESENNEI